MNVILVNEQDEMMGVMEKMEAHRQGLLHRAFSIFIFNTNGEMLLQRRAIHKYHSGGLWSNACCGHPQTDEETIVAARRRLTEEMGFETPLEKVIDLIYSVNLNNGLSEHEFDHVYAGQYDDLVSPNPVEVEDFYYQNMASINNSIKSSPQHYTVWFQLIFPKIEQWWLQRG